MSDSQNVHELVPNDPKIVGTKEHKVITLAEAPETKALQAKPVWEQELVAIESALDESTHQRQEAGNFYKHHASEANRLKARIEKQKGGPDQELRDQFKKHATEANLQKTRMDKLDVKIKELETKRSAIRAAHPEK